MMRSVLPPVPWVTVNQILPSCWRKVGYWKESADSKRYLRSQFMQSRETSMLKI